MPGFVVQPSSHYPHRGNPCKCKAARGLLCVMTDSARDSKRGALCHVSGTTARGEHVVASWKCWSRAVGDSGLRWELRRIAPSCGFSDKSKYTAVSSQISWNWSRWEAVLRSSGLQPEEHIGQSRRALLHLRERAGTLVLLGRHAHIVVVLVGPQESRMPSHVGRAVGPLLA